MQRFALLEQRSVYLFHLNFSRVEVERSCATSVSAGSKHRQAPPLAHFLPFWNVDLAAFAGAGNYLIF